MPNIIDETTQAMGLEIRRRREALGLTLPDLGERTGITANYIGTIENGFRDPCIRKVLAIAKGLECHIGQLFGQDFEAGQLSAQSIEAAEIMNTLPPRVRASVIEILRALTAKEES